MIVPKIENLESIIDSGMCRNCDAIGKPLSPRQYEIVQLSMLGLSRGEIAQKLGTSEHTVKNQVVGILDKFDLDSMDQVVSRLFIRLLSYHDISLDLSVLEE